MIQAVHTAAECAEFLRRIEEMPYFAAFLGTHLALYAEKPGSGWRFYLLPGAAVLALRGGTAQLCGRLPHGPGGAEFDFDAVEELEGFLRFLHIDRLVAGADGPPLGAVSPLFLWHLPRGGAVPVPPLPPEAARLVLDEHPAMLPVSRLVFGTPEAATPGNVPDAGAEPAEVQAFYSAACTAIAHGLGCCHALLDGGTPVCTVGCYEQSRTECYLSAGVTAPHWRGRGLAGHLIARLANGCAKTHAVSFTSAPSLRPFYARLGFVQNGILYDTKIGN